MVLWLLLSPLCPTCKHAKPVACPSGLAAAVSAEPWPGPGTWVLWLARSLFSTIATRASATVSPMQFARLERGAVGGLKT